MPNAAHQKSLQQALGALARSEYQEAHELAMSVLKADHTAAGGYFVMAIIAHRHGNVAKAEEVIRRALTFDADNPDYLLFRAQCLLDLSRNDEVKDIVRQLSKDTLSTAHQNDTLGVLHSKLGQHDLALQRFKSACQMVPDSAEFEFNLASCLQFCGELDEAKSAFEKVIALDAKNYPSYLSLAQLHRHSAEDNHVDRLLSAWKALPDDEVDGHLHIGHALAKAYEDLGEYDSAIKYLRAAKQRKLENPSQEQPDHQAVFATLEKTAINEPFGKGFESEEPVFIVGMPRTGTTLVERILSSHSQVEAAGELANLSLLVKQQLGTQSPWVLDAQTLSQADQLDFERLGKDYLESTRHLTGSSPHFIDKMPLNFLYIPIILRALPGAKIICLRRNPMDTCLSNYRQLFSTRFAYYSYAYSLRNTAEFYVLFHHLMDHFSGIYGERIFQMHYEALVEDPEQEARKLLSYCGLDWEPQCLQFQNNTAPVATASSLQVREKLYTRGIERWRHYEPWLGEVKEVLECGGISVSPGRFLGSDKLTSQD
jgi:tetratricopeptide (TPR) repeat protein